MSFFSNWTYFGNSRYVYFAVMSVYKCTFDVDCDCHILFQSIKVSTHVDNLNVDPRTGDIWLAAQPNYFRSGLYTINPDENTSPSQVGE